MKHSVISRKYYIIIVVIVNIKFFPRTRIFRGVYKMVQFQVELLLIAYIWYVQLYLRWAGVFPSFLCVFLVWHLNHPLLLHNFSLFARVSLPQSEDPLFGFIFILFLFSSCIPRCFHIYNQL